MILLMTNQVNIELSFPLESLGHGLEVDSGIKGRLPKSAFSSALAILRHAAVNFGERQGTCKSLQRVNFFAIFTCVKDVGQDDNICY